MDALIPALVLAVIVGTAATVGIRARRRSEPTRELLRAGEPAEIDAAAAARRGMGVAAFTRMSGGG